MKLQTQIPLTKELDNPIDYLSKLVLLGSCFAENMAEKLEYFKFQNTTNPFGIIFNPVSIEKLIQKSLNKTYFTNDDVFYHNEQWHCYDVHSKLSHSSKEELLKQLNNLIDLTTIQLTTATHFIITYGTSWVYRNIQSNEIVANCHKVPQKQFTKELLSIETIKNSIQNTIQLVQKVNPNCNIIFTVSPVRHIKDGFAENTVSKAHLVSSIYNVLQVPPLGARGHYFPAFELLMDELRDYRFYAEDMLHPNQTAMDYIWEKFSHIWMYPETHRTMTLVDTIQKGLRHKPFNPSSESYQKFLQKLESDQLELHKKYSHILF